MRSGHPPPTHETEGWPAAFDAAHVLRPANFSHVPELLDFLPRIRGRRSEQHLSSAQEISSGSAATADAGVAPIARAIANRRRDRQPGHKDFRDFSPSFSRRFSRCPPARRNSAYSAAEALGAGWHCKCPESLVVGMDFCRTAPRKKPRPAKKYPS